MPVAGAGQKEIFRDMPTHASGTLMVPDLDLRRVVEERFPDRSRRVTGDTAYGTVENVAAIERAGIRAYVALKGTGQGRPLFGKDEVAYDPERERQATVGLREPGAV